MTSQNAHFDLVVIGAGSGGSVAARFAAQLGAKVALVERNRIGGDCTWTGCVPSKALLKVAKVAHEVRTAARYGVVTTPPTVNMSAVREYVRGAIQGVYQFETPDALSAEGITVVLGEAGFLNDSAVAVCDRTIRSKVFLLTTGARPIVPPILGLQDVPFVTYEQLFENNHLPKSLIIVGGGPIGVEMGQAYQRLGAQVTVVGARVLPKEDPDVQQLMQSILEREGVRFISEKAKSARKDGNAIVIATDRQEVRGDTLMIAVGRKANIAGLDLEKAGVEYSSRGVSVDDRLRTNVKHIFAAGDVTGSYQFTHYAGWQAFQAVRNALLPGSASGVSNLVPWVTFTDPEVAHIGATEEQARAEAGNGVCVYRRELRQVDRAICENDLFGFLKIITTSDGTILGATIVGSRAGEAIAEIIVAMKQRMKIDAVANSIHPYPTYSIPVQQMAADIAVEHQLSGTRGRLMRWLSKTIR